MLMVVASGALPVAIVTLWLLGLVVVIGEVA
jgi:hypothetical protein